jgi:hypothetical protein
MLVDSIGMGCTLLWCLTYVLIILRARRDRVPAMPFAAMCANVAWEILYSFVFLPPGHWTDSEVWPHVLANLVWLALDVVIVATWLRYASADRPASPAPGWRVPVLALGLASALAVIIGIQRQFGALDGKLPGTTASCLRSLMMSALFVAMALRRNSMSGQSLPIALAKLSGSAMGSVFLYCSGFHSFFWVTLYVLTFLFDSIYTAKLFTLCYAVIPVRPCGEPPPPCPLPVTPDPPRPVPHPPSTIILDLGAASKKRVDQLRAGRGRLMAEVCRALAELRPAGNAASAARAVVVIVEQRRKRRARRPLLDLLPFKLW